MEMLNHRVSSPDSQEVHRDSSQELILDPCLLDSGRWVENEMGTDLLLVGSQGWEFATAAPSVVPKRGRVGSTWCHSSSFSSVFHSRRGFVFVFSSEKGSVD